MTDAVTTLVQQFEKTYLEHMQGLPIVNTRLQVEAVDFQTFSGHELGVLVTPWFMNLVLLPTTDEWADSSQGDTSSIEFPSGSIEFTTCHDEVMGTYLTAVLFRSVSDLSDQSLARELAQKIMKDLFVQAGGRPLVSRRDLFTGRRAL